MELAELIQQVNIVDYISQFVELEQRNAEFWGLSPFRDEKTPSFSVRPNPPVFYDYSAGIGGNIYTFIKHYFRCSNREAVEKIKEFAGCTDDVYVRQEKMAATMTCKRFDKPKTSVKQSKTTVLPDDYMLRYEKDSEKLDVWRSEGISDTSLDKFQVYYDRFSDRLVYPIRNMGGQIVNIGGRALDPEWKEKKQRKYCYFYSWGTINTIYGVAENIEYIKKSHELILFEGCKSVLLADTWGIHNCGAILTSHLSSNQLKILVKLGVRVVFALDKEVRIRDDRNIEKLKRYVNVEYIYDWGDLLGEKDAPVDKGREVFKKLYDNRLTLH